MHILHENILPKRGSATRVSLHSLMDHWTAQPLEGKFARHSFPEADLKQQSPDNSMWFEHLSLKWVFYYNILRNTFCVSFLGLSFSPGALGRSSVLDERLTAPAWQLKGLHQLTLLRWVTEVLMSAPELLMETTGRNRHLRSCVHLAVFRH